MAYSNHWAPVQAYYAAYLMIRAYFCASGQGGASKTHAGTLSLISNEIYQKPDLFPAPWNVLCDGDPGEPIAALINLPPNYVLKKINVLTSPGYIDFWSSYGLFLKTTRERQLQSRIDEWKHENHRKRITANARKSLLCNLPKTSLFNALYRLRLRSNYEDADSFLLTDQTEHQSERFNYGLQNVVWCAFLMLELLIARYMTKKKYLDAVESYVDRFKGGDRENAVLMRSKMIVDCF